MNSGAGEIQKGLQEAELQQLFGRLRRVSGGDVWHSSSDHLENTPTIFGKTISCQTNIGENSTFLLSEPVFKAGLYHGVTINPPGLILSSKNGKLWGSWA